MNLLKKAYCRIFQGVFRLAIPVLPYRKPQILDSVSGIPAVLRAKNADRVLIVTDSILHRSGIIEPLKSVLAQNQIFYTVYDETVANPTVTNVEAARARYLENGCKAIIGFGGGSAIDCAKAVGARIARPRLPVSKMKGILKIIKKIPFLIAVPTTAGTGSETTLATVITDDSSNHKFPINVFSLIPRVAVLDAEMTRSLPPHLTSTTGMDALTHAVEAFIGGSTVKDTREDALEAVHLIAENLEVAYADGNNMTARANMLKAAYLAGNAFSKSYVGYCHAVAHSLGGRYHIAHGLANAVLLPYVLDAYGSAIYKKGKQLAIAMHLADDSTDAAVATHRFIAKIRQMNENMGIPAKLKGIRREDIAQLAAYADKEANPLYPVPVLMDKAELERFYFDVMEEME